MEFDDKEKQLLKFLVEKEIKQFEKEEEDIMLEQVGFLALEEKYDMFLKRLLEKLT